MKLIVVFAGLLVVGCFSRMQMGSGSFTFEQGGMFPVSPVEAAQAECLHSQSTRPDGDARRCSMYGGYGYGGSYYGGSGYGGMSTNYYGYGQYGYSQPATAPSESEVLGPVLDRMGRAIQGISEQIEIMEERSGQ
ncbi:MAG: hypothetical protein ABII19_03060 [Patescibacteria group bacterium]